jgi:hypothetical protein
VQIFVKPKDIQHVGILHKEIVLSGGICEKYMLLFISYPAQEICQSSPNALCHWVRNKGLANLALD